MVDLCTASTRRARRRTRDGPAWTAARVLPSFPRDLSGLCVSTNEGSKSRCGVLAAQVDMVDDRVISPELVIGAMALTDRGVLEVPPPPLPSPLPAEPEPEQPSDPGDDEGGEQPLWLGVLPTAEFWTPWRLERWTDRAPSPLR